MARSRFSILISLALGAVVSALASFGQAVTAAVDRGLRFIFDAIPSPSLMLGREPEGFGGFFRPTFADPRVERHEAGFSRLAAARGI